MNGRPIIIFFFLALLLAPAVAQMAEPYEINPAKWVFYLKDDYELKTIYFNFQIKNTDTGPITVSLEKIPPDYLYSEQYPGVVAFPDYSWITISESEVTIPAGQTVEVPVYVTIPEQYYPGGATNQTPISNYNKSYEAWFLADQTSGPGNIQVDYRCRWVFLTPIKYVPPWQRPGALLPIQPEILYAILLIVVITIIAILVLRRRGGGRTKKKKEKKERGKEQEQPPDSKGGDVWD